MINSKMLPGRITVGVVAQGLGIATVVAYLIGFIVINAHLSGLGSYVTEAFRLRYLAAGMLTILALGIFVVLVGRRLVYLDHDMQRFSVLRPGDRRWNSFCRIFVMTEAVFSVLVAAYWCSWMLFVDQRPQGLMLGMLTVMIAIDYLVFTPAKTYQRRPAVALLITFALYLVALVLGYASASGTIIDRLFWSYLILGFLFTMGLDLLERFPTARGIMAPSLVLVALATASIVFGSQFYSHTKTEFGGGQPTIARLLIDEPINKALMKRLDLRDGITQELEILAETQDEFVVRTQEDSVRTLIRIRRDLVAGVLICRAARPTPH